MAKTKSPNESKNFINKNKNTIIPNYVSKQCNYDDSKIYKDHGLINLKNNIMPRY